MPAGDDRIISRLRKSGRRARGRAFLLGLLWAGASASGASPGGISQEPLAPRRFPPGKTMFVQLPEEQTGLRTENPYDDPRMWGELYQESETGSLGTGVAIGDYDGDGRPDIFVVSKTHGCRLFRNLGGFKFEDVTQKAGVAGTPGVWNEGATFVDINNDGRLDIYVCRYNAPNLLYVNQGDGTFKEMAHAYGLDLKDASVMAAFCDYDRDGWLDVYIVTNVLDVAKHPIGQRDYLFHNNRDGTFTDVTEKAGISGEGQGHSATWWDFDNDGWPDLYVANDFGTRDKLYHNNRNGTFTDVIDQVAPHTSFSSMGSDLGDVDNDGRIDLLVADMAASSHQGDQRGMADQRARAKEPADGTDLAPKYQRNALLINTGTGHVLEAANLAGIAATDWTWSVRLEDLDNDGRLDLFVTNGMNREQNNVDILRRTMAAETIADRIQIMRDSPVLAQTHMAFRNLGNLQFESVGAEWGLAQKGVGFGCALGDLSGDGNLDVVYSNFENGITICRNDNDTGHRADVYLRGTLSNRFGVGSTVTVESALGTQVRPLMLARGYLSSSEPMVHFGLGKDTVIRRLTVSWPSGHVQTFENLPVDQRFVVTEPGAPVPSGPEAARPAPLFEDVSRSAGLEEFSREGPLDDTYEQRLMPLRLNRRGPAIAVGDVFGTGQDDVVLGGTTVSPLRVLRQESPGRYREERASAISGGPGADDGPILLFDATGEGVQDLLVTTGGDTLPAGAPDYQPRLYLNDGHGVFRKAPDGTLPPIPICAGAVAAADFERNGRLGLFIGGRVLPGRYPFAPMSALLVRRGSHFEDATDALAPGLREVGMVTSALWTDVDGDGWPDLLLTLEWGHVRYFHNHGGKGFEDWTVRSGFSSAGTGWWTSIAPADFNGEGRIDYVVGNAGLNTQYHADPQHPAVMFSGDFNQDGAQELIEAYYEGDRLYPWRSRRDLGALIPSILKRFPQNNFFARATVSEVVGPENLERAERFSATELRSGVFLSQPDGIFRFESLPRIAQISPLQGIVAGNFLGDRHSDIFAAENSYAPIAQVGRFDGGLGQLLRDDGHAQIEPVPPAESGLIVPGDAKAVAVLDIDQDGWPDFLVTRNNNSTLAFRNQGPEGRTPLRIVLRGPAGNPTAVGARITVEFADGLRQTAEVCAGAGYYSQSSAACFFGHPASNPPKRIHIRWPSGSTGDYEVPPGTVRLALSLPAGEAPP